MKKTEFFSTSQLDFWTFFSAIVGVTIYKIFGNDFKIATALAVSVAIVIMHLTRTLHPPGGATALIAILGGERIHKLGYAYAFTPVLIGASLMLVVALFVNNLSSNTKRHYPTYWL